MTNLRAKPGFDWTRVTWGGPEDVRTRECSYCGKPFPDEEDDTDFMPLILWKANGAAAEFCEMCQSVWFGMESFRDEEEES